MIDELSRLLAVNGFFPHGYCLSWSKPLVATYVVSDILIFLSYFSMPVALGYFARQRTDFPYRWLLWLFAAFIMACGATHLMGVIVLWQPMYGLDALLKAITALISVVTAIMLWPLIPQALKLPSPEQWRRANEELRQEIARRQEVEGELRLAKEAAEEGLLQERLLMAAIVESSQDAILAETLEGILTSWNRAAEKIFGYTGDEIVGQSVLTLVPDEHRQAEAQALATIRRGQPIQPFEAERVCKDGRRIDMSVSVSPIQDQARQIVGASIIARDITERKQAEVKIRQVSEALQQLNETLELRVKERTLQLEEANALLAASTEDLARSNMELEQFAYVASHDLQEPLRMVVGFVQLIEKRLAAKLDSETSEFIGFAVDGSLRMQRLIQDILSYSRVSTRGEPPGPVDCAAVVKEALATLATKIADSGAQVEVLAMPTLVADRTQLTQLFQNLVGNAIKFCPEGKPQVRVEACRDGAQWRFSITDNGIGIAAEYRERIFGIFQRLHTRNEYDGTGIGLAICKRIVQRHGGEIGVEPAPDGGSIFWFTLPAGPAQ